MPRVLVWFWGTGGAGIRLTDRIATLLAQALSPSHVSLSCHADNALSGAAAARGHPVTTVSGAAGYRSVAGLALQALPRLYSLWRQLRRERPQAIVIPMNFALAWPFCLLPRLMNIPYAFLVHDAVPHAGDYAPRWQVLTQGRLIRHAGSLVVPSAFTRDQVGTGWGTGRPVRVLSLASLTPSRRAEARGAPGSPLRFLFLGRLIAYKGLALLAEALGRLADRDDWRLTIAGSGPEQEAVEVAFGMMRQVDLTHLFALPEQAIEALIAEHDILVCPYIEASQSGVIPEAQADAMPCVVTPVGALPEQIGHGRAGWIAYSTSAEDLAAVLIDALDHRDGFEPRSEAALEAVAGQEGPAAMRLILADLLGSSSG